MLGVIITRGKTVAEAVRNAARQFKVSEDEIEYEIVDRGSRGFFGRSAVIQAALKRRTSADVGSQAHEAGLEENAEDTSTTYFQSEELVPEGTAWVKNGQIVCKNGIFHYALVTPCDGLVLRVNGEAVKGTTLVIEEDVIDVELLNERVEPRMSLTVSPDKMQVTLTFEPGYNIVRRIRDHPPSRELLLEVTEDKQVVNHLTEQYVDEALSEIGVQFGIDRDQIRLACQAQTPTTYVVAKGIEPICGTDGEFELASKSKTEQKDRFTLSDIIDWKERFSLHNVRAGELIGQATPATPGVNGRDVFNQEIPVAKVRDLTIVAEEGTALRGEQKVVATASGRVRIQRRANHTMHFSILPQLVHNGNVNIQTGNIRFHGDVYVLGNIEEGMTVEVGGNLHVTGAVAKATIRTRGDTVIQGPVIGADIICGHANLFWDNMLPSFRLIHRDLIGVITALKQLEANQAFTKGDIAKKGLQPLLKLLTEVKFKDLPVRIRELSRPIKNERQSFDPDVHKIMDFLEKSFCYFHPLVSKLIQLESLVEYMGTIIVSIEQDANKKMNIRVQSLTNSTIKSAWDVNVERFCYGSDIYCKGGFQVQGILRGGRVQAGNFIEAKEIGSNSGSRTEVWLTNDEGYIQADTIGTDTVIKISKLAKKLINEEMDVRIRVDDHGDLILR